MILVLHPSGRAVQGVRLELLFSGKAVSNLDYGTDVSLLCMLRPLLQAGHSLRGVLSCVCVCACVRVQLLRSRNLNNETD